MATALSVYAIWTGSTSVTPNDFASDTLDPPTGLTATGGSSSIVLNWTATVDTYASGHRVLRGTASGGPYTQIAEVTPRTNITYTDSPAVGTYYYVVRAFYQSWESVNSNEATAASFGVRFVKTVGTATQSSSSNSSITITVPAAGVAAADSIIVSVTAGTFAGAVSCSDTKGNSYAVDADVTGVGRLFVCSAHNVTALASGDTITATYPSLSGVTTASANEFSGVSATTPADKVSTAAGNNASPSSGSTATTTQANELLFGAIAHNSTPTFAPGSGYNLAGQVIGGSGSGQKTNSPEYRIVSATESYAANGTLSSGQQWQAAIVTYKASP
ncbi:MAG: hypothetical protein Q8Q00_07240 [Dehalococcoidia bacterium]|nr:hypothetical protein [Dehalococcoidia bacterium]